MVYFARQGYWHITCSETTSCDDKFWEIFNLSWHEPTILLAFPLIDVIALIILIRKCILLWRDRTSVNVTNVYVLILSASQPRFSFVAVTSKLLDGHPYMEWNGSKLWQRKGGNRYKKSKKDLSHNLLRSKTHFGNF